MNRVERPLVPMPIILEAIDGDAEALAIVISHYRGFIKYLSLRNIWDEYGNGHFCMDNNIELRLEAKLIASIVTGFKILEK